jgi:hypothetical protein
VSSNNWELCALCQKDTAVKLVCPANSLRTNCGSSYKTLAENLLKFQELGNIPIEVPLEILDDGEGIEETTKHHAINLVSINVVLLNYEQKRENEKKTLMKIDQLQNHQSCRVHQNGGQHYEWKHQQIMKTHKDHAFL